MNKKYYKQKNAYLMQVTSLLMVIFLAGCSVLKVGHDFDMKTFEGMVRVGETSKAQVLAKMGLPKSEGVSVNNKGERLVEWTYFHAVGKLSGMDDAKLKILQIRFDQYDIVRSYNWTSSY